MSFPQPLGRLYRWGVLPLATAFVVAAMWQPVSGQGQPPAAGAPGGANDGQEVLTRGPVHEAFGQPTVFNPKPGLGIPKQPPQPIEELPPEEKPEGDNVAWIGGYWSWDDDRKDFLWVSGFWRVLPPNRQWMPGYWNDAAGQHQWVSGYWASAEMREQEFIDQAPPASLEQGAPPTAPSDDHVWLPGTWVHQTSRYLWRPGYWIVNQPGWVWIPASYYWTPSGYVFVDGYWDYSIRRRGVLFAPVYFDPVVIVRPRFYYRPAICLDIDLITPHFFCRPTYGHYYFGDYYATSYLSVGITPWFHFHYARGAHFYSSDFSYYACHYRRADPHWAVNVRIGYERARDHVSYRPPRTFAQQTTIINNTTIVNNNTTVINKNTLAMAKPLKDVSAAAAKSGDAPMKFEKISDVKARDFGKTATEVRKVGQQRVALERAAATGGGTAPGKTINTAKDGGTRRVSMPKSPLVAKAPAGDAGAGNAGRGVPNVGGIAGTRPSHVPPPIPGTVKSGGTTAGTNLAGTKSGGAVTENRGGAGAINPGGRAGNLPGAGTGAGGDKPTTLPGGAPDKVTRPGTTIPGGAPEKVTRPGTTLPGSSGAGSPPVKGGDRLPPINPRDGGSSGSSSTKPGSPPRSGGGLPGGISGGPGGKSTPPASGGSRSGGSSSGSSSGKDKDKGKDK